MATASVARPSQVLRQRRDVPRPSLTKTASRMNTIDGAEPAAKKRRMNEPLVRDNTFILRKHKGKAPSLVVHLHPTHFRFEQQDGSFAYDSPMKLVLTHMRNGTVPHEMLEELLNQGVTFYDGCLIVEVHSHRSAGTKTQDQRGAGGAGDGIKFSMHNYNEHITPSGLAAYPAKAKANPSAAVDKDASDMPAPKKQTDGPKVTTIVLHPTPQTMHEEMRILATTLASDVRGGKKGSRDGATPVSGQPSTPQLSVPPTPLLSRGPLSQNQKMALDEGDYYAFEAEVLLSTEPPLLLDPASNPAEAQKALDLLAHPLHSAPPPSPKTRKRTTAEMAADDAQAAEAERRMLIMDERIKPSTSTNENSNQGAAASLGFSRFKTLEAVRQKHEERDRLKKEDETRLATEKRVYEEQQQKALGVDRQKQQLLMHQAQITEKKRQMMMAQQQQNLQQQQQQQQQQMQMGVHAHPTPQQSMANHSSPIVRQQTPMMNSSPMMPQGGFGMSANPSSQGGGNAGSPPRPPSAAMQHPQIAMARGASQQPGQGSRKHTPQIPQGTPSLAQAVPNRQMSQTPRMPHGSPMAGQDHTPTSMGGNMMSTPQMGHAQNGLTPQQMAMLQARQQQLNNHGSPPQGMTPAQIAQVQAEQHQRQLMQAQQNPQMMAQHQQRLRQMQLARQAQLTAQAGSPMPQQTPQMGHAHPQQNAGDPSQQQAMAMAQANAMKQRQMMSQQQQQWRQQLQNLAHQHGGTIPQHVAQSLPPQLQQVLQQQQRQAQMARQQAALRAGGMNGGGAAGMGGGMGGQEVVGGQPNAQYMANLRHQQQLIAQQAMQGQMNGGQGQGFGGQGGQDQQLNQRFAEMQNALNMQQQHGRGGGM